MQKARIRTAINIDEIILDSVLALFIPVVYSLLLPQGPKTLTLLTPALAVALTAGITFFTALHTGRLYNRFEERGEDNWLVKTTVFLIATGVFLGPILMLAAFRLIPPEWMKREWSMLAFLIPGASALAGMLIGFTRRSRDAMMKAFYIPYVMVFATGPFMLIVFLVGGPASAVLIMLAAILILFVAPAVLRSRLSGWNPQHPLTLGSLRTGRQILLPMLFAAALILWQEMTLLAMIKAALNNKTVLSPTGAVMTCVIGGLIPVRLLAMLTPPRRWLNIAAGTVVMGFYILSVLDLTKALQNL